MSVTLRLESTFGSTDFPQITYEAGTNIRNFLLICVNLVKNETFDENGLRAVFKLVSLNRNLGNYSGQSHLRQITQ